MAGERALRRRLRWRACRRVAVERDVAGKFPVTGRDVAGAGDGAVGNIRVRPASRRDARRRHRERSGGFPRRQNEWRGRNAAPRGCRTSRLRSDSAKVEARTILTRASSTSSSSAAICASAVTIPWPISTLPGETITCPSAAKLIHDDSFGFAARLMLTFRSSCSISATTFHELRKVMSISKIINPSAAFPFEVPGWNLPLGAQELQMGGARRQRRAGAFPS